MKNNKDEMLKVTLLEYTPDPERVVAMSARLCYSRVGASELAEKMSVKQVESLVSKIIDLGHYSTLEHVSFTFAIEGISRVLTHQLVRHRIASYSQQSQRYVKEDAFEYIIPGSIADKPAAKARYEQLMADIQSAYNDFNKMGVHQEDARYILPGATESKIVVTMNARSLLNFFQLRCCMRAQWEIRALAQTMLSEVKKVAPLLFAKAGATCISHGYCSEGEYSCGLLERLKAGGTHE